MFIDIVSNRNSRPTILIRQAYRESGKTKKRTLANITKFPPDMIEKIRKILRGADLADAPAKLEGAFEISRSLQHGNAADHVSKATVSRGRQDSGGILAGSGC